MGRGGRYNRHPWWPAARNQRAIEPVEKAAAKERQGTRTDKLGGKLPPGSKRRPSTKSRDKVAQATGMSARTLSKAEAVVAAAERDPENYGKDLIRASVYIRKRAERRLSELMAAQPKAKPPGGSKKYPKKDRVVSGPDPLLDLGIDKHLANRARKSRVASGPGF